MDRADRRTQMLARHGAPRRVPHGDALRQIGRRHQVHPRDVLAFWYRDRAAAEAYAASAAGYGQAPLGLAPVDGGILGILDLRGELERHGVSPTDPAESDDYLPPA